MSKFIQKISRGSSYCHYSEIKYPKEWIDDDKLDVCPLCNQKFIEGDPIYMVITYNLFPNTNIHKSCVDTDLLITTHALIKSHNQFLKCINKNKGWCDR